MADHSDTSTAYFSDSVIDTDRSCTGCGYNLRGLKLGGNCPECGRIVTNAAKPRSQQHYLGEAPGKYLAILGLGLLVMGMGGLAMTFMVIAPSVISLLSGGPLVGDTRWILLATLMLVAWLGGLGVLMIPRPIHTAANAGKSGGYEWSILRLLAVASQICWIGVLVFGALSYHTGFAPLRWTAFLAWIVAAYGMSAVALLIEKYADWASDAGMARRMQVASSMLAILLSVILVAVFLDALGTGFGRLLMAFALVVGAGWVVMAVMMAFACVQLASGVRWAVVNAREARNRDIRIAERAVRAKRQAAANIGVPGALPVDEAMLAEVVQRHENMPLPTEEEQASIGSRHQKVIRPVEDADPYALEKGSESPAPDR